MPQRSRQPRLPGIDEPEPPATMPGRRSGKRQKPSAETPGDGSAAAQRPDSLSSAANRPPASEKSAGEPAGEGPADIRGWKVWIIDSHSLIFQVFHALPEMVSSRGESVGAVFGFVRDILYLIEEKRPDCLLCAFDLPGPTFRHEIYENYKIQREEMPEDLRPQIEKIRRFLRTARIPVLEAPGFEADDVLATVAELCDRAGAECYLVTGDKDCRQLISDQVKVYNVRKNEVYGQEELKRDWGVTPEQVVDFQALVGDPVDNVPGVPLIGPKIAGQLLQQYGTLDEVLAHAGEISGKKRRENLQGASESVQISRRLVVLDRQTPVHVDWRAGRIEQFDKQAMAELFAEFGFRSLSERFGRAGEPPDASGWEADYQIVDTPAKLAELVARLQEQPTISVDTETTDVMPRWAKIVGYSFAFEPGLAFYIPVMAPPGEPCLEPVATLEALRPVLEDPTIKKLGQNLKYDMIVLRVAGVKLAGAAFDTMIASYLLDAGERNHSLDELSRRYLDHTMVPISDLIGTGKNQKRMDEVPVADVGWYAAEDADVPTRLRPILQARLDEAELNKLFDEVEMPLVDVLAEMEFTGVRVDLAVLARLSGEYAQRIERAEEEIHRLAGRELNVASPRQLAEVLFTDLGLPIVKKTKTGPSTDVDVLEQLADLHALPAKILEYRQFAKLKSTYVDALPALVHPGTGRVHASFNQVVAATGRLSSNSPNLQNIPVRSEEGREIRSAFKPGHDGWKLLAADYSQIELRVLADFSQDQTLLEAFAQGQDIHARVASEVNRVPLADVTSEMRRGAKAVNFGIIYGQSPFGLARSLSIEQDEAAEYIERYFSRYPGVERFLTKTLAECQEKGYVRTILGRRRAIRGIRADGGRQRNLPERTAINTVIQGSAADIIKLAMIAIHRDLADRGLRARMLLQIHDELVFEVPPEELEELTNLVVGRMENVLPLSVPLRVDVKTGDNWADCE